MMKPRLRQQAMGHPGRRPGNQCAALPFAIATSAQWIPDQVRDDSDVNTSRVLVIPDQVRDDSDVNTRRGLVIPGEDPGSSVYH